MTEPLLAVIVEGHAEVQSVRILVRRFSHAARLLPPIRVKRNRVVRPGELEKAIELSARKLGGTGGILVLLDADDDCPATLAATLLARARDARADVPCRVVLAKKEFEAWFLAALESLRGRRGIPDHASSPSAPEEIRGAKERLGHLMGRRYEGVTDQPAFAELFDVELASQRSPSFAKLRRDLAFLLSSPAVGSSA